MKSQREGFLTCDICGKDFIKVHSSIYQLTFAGKTCHFCSYNCYRIGQKTKEKSTNETLYQKLYKQVRQDCKEHVKIQGN